MSIRIVPDITEPRYSALAMTASLLFVFMVGLGAILLAILAALWVVAQIALLIIQAVIETCSSIATTFQAADPLVKFCLLVCVGFVVYLAVQRMRR